MRKIIESSESLSDHFHMIKQAINDETATIALYDEMLKKNQLPSSVRSVIEEIRDDEKDHLVILTNILQDLVEEELPGFGDEDDMMKIVDEEEVDEEDEE